MSDDVQVTFAGAPGKVAAAIHAMHGAPIAKARPDPDLVEATGAVIKAIPEKRFVLGVAYQAGRDDRIVKGLDGHRDFMTADEVELAAWRFVAKGSRVGLLHSGFRAGNEDLDANDGTEGHALVVESSVYRGPDWVLKDADGEDVVIKAGDWLVGAVLDETAWDLWKRGRITGWSPQGVATRRTRKASQ